MVLYVQYASLDGGALSDHYVWVDLICVDIHYLLLVTRVKITLRIKMKSYQCNGPHINGLQPKSS